jgi:hypothetical protein
MDRAWDHDAMPGRLLEREVTLAALSRAATEAAAGRGSVALVTGEAGPFLTNVSFDVAAIC